MIQVFSRFHPDKAAADNCCRLNVFIFDQVFNLIGIGQMFKRKPRQPVKSFQRRNNRCRTGCQNQFVISIFTAVGRCYFFGRRLYGGYPAVKPEIDAKHFSQYRCFCHLHFVAQGYNTADIIRQAAIGNRYFVRLFQNRDFGFVVKPAQPGSTAEAAGTAADNYNFHRPSPFRPLKNTIEIRRP